jgi:hypothetical protein
MVTNNLLSFDNQLLKQLSSNNVNAFYRMQGWFLSFFSILKEIEMLNVVKKTMNVCNLAYERNSSRRRPCMQDTATASCQGNCPGFWEAGPSSQGHFSNSKSPSLNSAKKLVTKTQDHFWKLQCTKTCRSENYWTDRNKTVKLSVLPNFQTFLDMRVVEMTLFHVW